MRLGDTGRFMRTQFYMNGGLLRHFTVVATPCFINGITIAFTTTATRISPLTLLTLYKCLPTIHSGHPRFFTNGRQLRNIILRNPRFMDIRTRGITQMSNTTTLRSRMNATNTNHKAGSHQTTRGRLGVVFGRTSTSVNANFPIPVPNVGRNTRRLHMRLQHRQMILLPLQYIR